MTKLLYKEVNCLKRLTELKKREVLVLILYLVYIGTCKV